MNQVPPAESTQTVVADLPNATEQEAKAKAVDLEKGAGGAADGKPVMPSFPEGGLMGWLCVLGATLVRE